MSDAYTDIARDEKRRERIIDHLKALKECLEFTGGVGELVGLRTKVIVTAVACDAVHGTGYWTLETSLSEGLMERLNGLLARDPVVWEDFLASLQGDYLTEFRKLSPFKNTPSAA